MNRRKSVVVLSKRLLLASHALSPLYSNQYIEPLASVLTSSSSCLALALANARYSLLSVAIGLRCTDGVILGVERLLHSKLLVKGSNRRIQSLDEHVGMASAGLLADGKHLAGRGREEAANFRDQYNAPVSLQVSVENLRHARVKRKGCDADVFVLIQFFA